MTHVLTLIAPDRLDDSMLSTLRQTLGSKLLSERWLAPGRVLDIGFRDLPDMETVARPLCPAIDLVAQPEPGRRKKLLVADMDSTIVTSETLDELAAYAGLKEQIAAITMRSMRGELDFQTALRERVSMLKGLAETAMAETYKQVELMPGAATLIATMRGNGCFCVLASGGFDYFTSRVRELCGFDRDHANHLVIEDGKLTGKVREPILDRDSKLGYLRRYARELGLQMSETMAVGDGANDLAMIQAAGLGVAYHAKPIVAAEARFRVDHNDLTALLFAQGYPQESFLS